MRTGRTPVKSSETFKFARVLACDASSYHYMQAHNCSAPYLAHWHLRKCGGTTIRGILQPYERYVEAHTDWRGLHLLERRRRLPRGEADCVRRIVVLREPYSLLLSELDNFPADFPIVGGRLSIIDNHFVCSTTAMLGMCHLDGGATKCDAKRVVDEIDAAVDFVGFFERLDHTFRALERWLACHSSHMPAAALRALSYARRAYTQSRGSQQDNITARLSAGHQHSRGEASREEATSRLLLAPTREEFGRRHPCSVMVYELARARFGPSGGSTARGRRSGAATTGAGACQQAPGVPHLRW